MSDSNQHSLSQARGTISSCHKPEILGVTAHQNYQVINLWEIEAEVVFEQNLSSLTAVCFDFEGGNGEQNLHQALRSLCNDRKLAETEPLLSFFANFVSDIPLVQPMMR